MSLKPRNVDFDATWGPLRETVRGVVTLQAVPRAVWSDRFTDVYSLCVAQPEPLADRLYSETKTFLDAHVRALLEDVRAAGEERLLRSYHDAWARYSEGVAYLHRLYLYLNQQHIRKQKLSEAEIIYGNLSSDIQEQMEIGELGLEIWKRNMIEPLKENLVGQLLDGIHADRLGLSHHNITDVIRGVIQSFVSVEEFKAKANLGLYEEIFEKPFLAASGEYYKREASRLLQTCDVSLYMERVTQHLKEETLRCQKYLHRSSFPKVRAKCDQHMVAEHLAFLHGECRSMVRQERRRDLALVYPLLRSVRDGLGVLVAELTEHVQQRGLEAVTCLRGENVHTQFVENVLAVHAKYGDLVADVFRGDQAFLGALDKACSRVVNHRVSPKAPCRSPELLAKYCDSLLRKSSKGLSDSEIDDKLARSVTVFKYVDDKDVFQKFYSRMLAKRLIHQQSQSMDAEEAMIDRLKQACGYEFTNKLHRMFTDVSVSADLTNKFNANLRESYGTDLGFNFTMYVLQAGAWPLGQSTLSTFCVPQELEKAVQKFENYYHCGFSGRKLTWLHHLCQGELKLGYLKKPYQITMQTFQMAILLQFQNIDSLSRQEVRDFVQLNEEQFEKHVAGLVEAKLLLCDGRTLTLNTDYSNKRTKFRITAAAHRDSPQEVEQTLNAVDEDRKLYLQAAIVRVMKSRKVLKHTALVHEVLAQSRASFAPTVGLIKKCIEALIDKQYLERTPHSTDEYSYVA